MGRIWALHAPRIQRGGLKCHCGGGWQSIRRIKRSNFFAKLRSCGVEGPLLALRTRGLEQCELDTTAQDTSAPVP